MFSICLDWGGSYKNVAIYQIIDLYLIWVQFMLCKLYLSEIDLKIGTSLYCGLLPHFYS